MRLAISTHWNACHHDAGEKIVDQILELGFSTIELGYDLTADLVPGIKQRVAENAVRVSSVHNYCPVPIGAPGGHPELFLLGSLDKRIREMAVAYTSDTIRFAAEVGASTVVVHAARVEMRRSTHDLIQMAAMGQLYSERYDKLKMDILEERDKKAPKHMGLLLNSLEQLLPILDEHNITLAMENLPTWDGMPSEMEAEEICTRFKTPHIRYWHDIGHGQVRENLGFISQIRWLERLAPWLAGMHVHDVAPPASDHIMPPDGKVDFPRLKTLAQAAAILVLEPAPHTPPPIVKRAREYLEKTWGDLNKGTTP